MKKLIFSMMIMAFLAVASFGQPHLGLVYHEVQVVDEEGINVTDITSVDIYLTDTTTSQTIYKERGAVGAITLPMTTATTNTTLSNGSFSWWGAANYDFSITDGTNTHTNYGFRPRTPSEGKITFASYLHAASTTTFGDAVSITMGTSPDWVINAGATADLITFTPTTDGAVWRVGEADGSPCADLQWYTASGVGLLISESANTLGITGLTTNINVSSNYATNINTGTSTGAVTIGSSTSGAWAIDGTSTGTLNADASIGITTTDASGDITIDATLGSVKIDSGEAAADAIVLVTTGAAGGIDITSLADIDITTTGTAGEDITIQNVGGSIYIRATEDANSVLLETDGGTSETLTLHSDQGTSVTEGAASIQLLSDAGGIGLESNANLAKSIWLIADGGATETILIESQHGTGAAAATEEDAAIQLYALSGGIGLMSKLNGDDSIRIEADGGANENIFIRSNQGTGADSITLLSDVGGIAATASAGGIVLTADGATAGDILIDAEDKITILSADADAQGIYIHADGGTSETIQIHADQGTSATSIYLKSDAGGITLLSDGSANGDILVDCEDDMALTSGDDMTLTVAGDFTLAVTGATVLPADVLLKTTTALTHDHMDNLAGTPKELVAAVAGNTIEFISAIFALDYDSTAWTEASAPDDLCIRYEDGTGAIVSELLDATGFATATADTVLFLAPTSDIQAGTTGAIAVTEANSTNKALVLDNTGDEWTNSGDSQVVVIVYYRLHTTAELGL